MARPAFEVGDIVTLGENHQFPKGRLRVTHTEHNGTECGWTVTLEALDTITFSTGYHLTKGEKLDQYSLDDEGGGWVVPAPKIPAPPKFETVQDAQKWLQEVTSGSAQ